MTAARKLPAVVAWSKQLLAADEAVLGTFFLWQYGLRGEYLGIVCEDGQGHVLEARLRQLLEEVPELLAVAAVPELPRTLVLLHHSGARLQWGIEEVGTLRASPRLQEAQQVSTGARLADLLRRSRRLGRGAAPADLAELDRLFWIDAALVGECLEQFQVGAAELTLDRLQEHAWAWIDVREMEKELREGAFPQLPDPLWSRPGRGELATLIRFFEEWLRFYRSVRQRVARREHLRLDPRAEQQILPRLRAQLQATRDLLTQADED